MSRRSERAFLWFVLLVVFLVGGGGAIVTVASLFAVTGGEHLQAGIALKAGLLMFLTGCLLAHFVRWGFRAAYGRKEPEWERPGVQAVPPPPLLDLAVEYHIRTEVFDRSVCTGRPSPEYCAMPATPDEMSRITSNARREFRELSERARALGFSAHEFRTTLSSMEASSLARERLAEMDRMKATDADTPQTEHPNEKNRLKKNDSAETPRFHEGDGRHPSHGSE